MTSPFAFAGLTTAVVGAAVGGLFYAFSTFVMLVLNATLTAVVVPLAATSLARLALTSLGLLLLGIALFHIHRVTGRGSTPAMGSRTLPEATDLTTPEAV